MPEPRATSLTTELRAEYVELYTTTTLHPERRAAVESTAKAIHASRERYQAISAAVRVPWFVVGVVHLLECGLRFDRHLHNGDPLASRTTRVPRGRPTKGTPPFGFEESGIDALEFDGFSAWGDWSLSGILYKLEAFNGFGYRAFHPEVKTPYLWSFTNHYTAGKYAADGKFDPQLVSQQVGAAAVLRALSDLGLAELDLGAPPPAPGHDPPPPSAVYPGRVVKRGDADRAIVLSIQRRLVELNCGPLEVDGIFGSGTESAVKLLQSRMVDGRGHSLVIDGAVGLLTWEALFGQHEPPPEAETDDALLELAVKIAASQVGIRETPANSNRGADVEAYQRSVGIPAGLPWCAAFVYWCFQRGATQLGVENPVHRTGGVLDHWIRARKNGVRSIDGRRAVDDPSLVRAGQIFIMDHGNGKGHTGLVQAVRGGLLDTIEGNTNALGSREGDGVYLKQRKISEINAGFLDYATHRITGGAPVPADPAPAPDDLPDVAAAAPASTSGGLLLDAARRRIFEEPTWVMVPFAGHLVRVGAHALRAKVGGQLLRLPVSYREVIEIARLLGWLPPTSALSDAIWRAATLRIGPVPQGRWATPEDRASTERKMKTLEFTLSHDRAIEAQIRAGRRAELASTQGKDWILSPRNVTKANAATTYGWHDPKNRGLPIQGLGQDYVPPRHDDAHFDYSQTLRPVQRVAVRASDGAEVDLLDVVAESLPEAAIAPFR